MYHPTLCFSRVLNGMYVKWKQLSNTFNKQCCWDIGFPSPLGLSSINANMMLVFFIATSYAILQPLLLMVTAIYFLVLRTTLLVQLSLKLNMKWMVVEMSGDSMVIKCSHHFMIIIHSWTDSTYQLRR